MRDFIVSKLDSYDIDQIVMIKQLVDDENYLVRIQREYFVELLEIIFNNARLALKGVPDPQIHFLTSLNRSRDEYTLKIWDNGPGFPEKIIGDLLKTPIQKEEDEVGSGIGLLMVRMIVESFGGKMSAKNKDKGGAYIEMNFPIDTLK